MSSQAKILAVSDQIDPRIHSASLRERMPDVDFVVGCGDVPARYLEFLADALNRPVYFVHGNHVEERNREGILGTGRDPMGCIDLGGRLVEDQETGLLIAGFPGCPKYSGHGDCQYSETEMYWMMFKLAPRLVLNRLRHGRWLDVLVTHAPPRGVNDRSDPTHKGFSSMRHFIDWFQPAYHLHGHVHLYDRNEPCETPVAQTRVINVYPFKLLDVPERE